MMKPVLYIAAVAALTPGLALAAEASLVRTFSSVCMANASPAASLALARSQGFVTPPDAALDKFKVAELPGAKMLWKTTDGALSFVIAGDGPMPGVSTMTASICAVLEMPQSADPEGALQTLLKVGPPQGQGGQKIFMYEEQNGARKAVDQTDGAAALRTMSAGTMRMAIAMNREGASMMMLIAPKAPAGGPK